MNDVRVDMNEGSFRREGVRSKMNGSFSSREAVRDKMNGSFLRREAACDKIIAEKIRREALSAEMNAHLSHREGDRDTMNAGRKLLKTDENAIISPNNAVLISTPHTIHGMPQITRRNHTEFAPMFSTDVSTRQREALRILIQFLHEISYKMRQHHDSNTR
jgi:hypothetical protein